MGKRQRDCAECGGPVGIIGRDLCCRCTARAKDAAAKQPCLTAAAVGCWSSRQVVA